jgi:hypothetical protein
MTSVWVAFVLIFTVVQLCAAEYVVYGQKMTLDDNLSLNLNRCHHPLNTQHKLLFSLVLKTQKRHFLPVFDLTWDKVTNALCNNQFY